MVSTASYLLLFESTCEPAVMSYGQYTPPTESSQTTSTSSISTQNPIDRDILPAIQDRFISQFACDMTCHFWFENASSLANIAAGKPDLSPPLSSASTSHPAFVNWCRQVLSLTQVSRNVVLLALLFIFRLKTMNSSVIGRPGSEYRLLTVALMLGNKFLDDNTYTNKTWADVTRIPVKEIHVMETEFLSNMRYQLHCSDTQFTGWRKLLARFFHFREGSRISPTPHLSLPSSPPPARLTPNSKFQQQSSSPVDSVKSWAQKSSRKRSLPDHLAAPPPKRPLTLPQFNPNALPSYLGSQFPPISRSQLPKLRLQQLARNSSSPATKTATVYDCSRLSPFHTTSSQVSTPSSLSPYLHLRDSPYAPLLPVQTLVNPVPIFDSAGHVRSMWYYTVGRDFGNYVQRGVVPGQQPL